jgi:microcystin-dependent protein
MANYEATRYDWDGQYLTNVEGVNTGIVIPWGSTSVPSGFLECNGQSVSTSTYAALFAVIGYTYGGSGASFLLPDLTDRTVLSRSNNKALASTGGANTVAAGGSVSGNAANTTLTTNEIAAHTHNAGATSMGSASGNPGNNSSTPMTTADAGGGGAHGHSLSSVTFTGSADSVLQPYLTLIYIIKT